MDRRHLTREEAMALLRENNTPEHVIKHCVAVADTALRIGKALNGHGFNFDLELILGAGLIHDIARVKDRHWDVGAVIAERAGFPQEADIIKVHMFHTPPLDVSALQEVDLVCLGDRLVKEHRYVGLAARMQYIIDKAKAGGNPEAEAAIRKKTENMQTLIDGIETVIGMSIDDLIKEKGCVI